MARGSNYSTSEISKLKYMYNNGASVEEISNELGRPIESIRSKLLRIGVTKSKNSDMSAMSGRKWRKEDIAELKYLVDSGYTVKQLSEYFGRSETSIIVKVNRIGKRIEASAKKTWLDSEEESFKEDWNNPEMSISKLKKKYKRTWFGLRKRAQILNLGPRNYNDTYLNIEIICEEMQVSRDRVHSWIKKGLKTKRNRSGKTKILIDQDELLKFLEQHQELFEADKVSKYLFAVEPEWLIDKRKVDANIHKDKNRIPYTNEEDKQIQALFKLGKSDEYIAEKLHRGISGIAGRRRVLGLVKNEYMDYEVEILKKYSRYKTAYELAQMLPLRTPRGIMYKCEKLGIPCHISKEACEPEENKKD